MKTLVSLALVSVALLFPVVVQAQESLADRVARVETNTNAVNAMLTRQRADILDLQASVNELNAKVDALMKQQGVKLTTSTNWAGDKSFSTAATTSSWSTQQSFMSSSGGACAGGQCGVARGPILSGGLRLFRR